MDPEEEEEREEGDALAYLEKLDRFLNGKEQTTLYLELERKGYNPPFAENLNDEELSRELTNLIWALWDFNVWIDDADHLSDRELYLELLDLLDEPTVVFPDHPSANFHWSPIGSYGEEDMVIYNRYYASDQDREDMLKEWPDTFMPEKEMVPYYRSWLPQRAGEV